MYSIEQIIHDYDGSIKRLMETGESIWFDDKKEAVIVANHIRQMGYRVILKQLAHCFGSLTCIFPVNNKE